MDRQAANSHARTPAGLQDHLGYSSGELLGARKLVGCRFALSFDWNGDFESRLVRIMPYAWKADRRRKVDCLRSCPSTSSMSSSRSSNYLHTGRPTQQNSFTSYVSEIHRIDVGVTMPNHPRACEVAVAFSCDNGGADLAAKDQHSPYVKQQSVIQCNQSSALCSMPRGADDSHLQIIDSFASRMYRVMYEMLIDST